MGYLNKEKVVILVAVVIALYGLTTAFSGEGVSGTVPDIPLETEGVVPPMPAAKVTFLEKTFDFYWGTGMPDPVRNPWTPPEQTSKPTEDVFPLEEPNLRAVAKVVPVPPFAPRQSLRPVLRQLKPPASIEEAQPGEGTQEGADEGTEGDSE